MARNDIFTTMSGEINAGEAKEPVPDEVFRGEHLAPWQDVLQARRSIRVYDEEPIPEERMRTCLREAMLAPSSSNLQPWEMYWARTREKKKAVAKACMGQPAASTAGELVVVVARYDKWNHNRKRLLELMSDGGKTELPPSVATYYKKLMPLMMRNDPLGVMNLVRRIGFTVAGLRGPIVRQPVNDGDHRIWAHTQAALAAQTLMLSLTAHGYDSCPMGGIDSKRLARILNLPSGAEVAMVISAGRRKPEGLYGPRVRLPVEEMIHEC